MSPVVDAINMSGLCCLAFQIPMRGNEWLKTPSLNAEDTCACFKSP